MPAERAQRNGLVIWAPASRARFRHGFHGNQLDGEWKMVGALGSGDQKWAA